MKKISAIMLCMVLMLGTFNTFSANAIAGQDDMTESLSLDGIASIAPQSREMKAASSISVGNIDYQLHLTEEGHGEVIGCMTVDGHKQDFFAKGFAYPATQDSNELFLVDMLGTCGDQTMTFIAAKDITAGQCFTAVTVGKLSGTEAPIEYTFGELTESCGKYYSIQALTENKEVEEDDFMMLANTDANRAISNDIVCLGTEYISLDGQDCIALTAYAPRNEYKGSQFELNAKITGDRDAIDDYLVSCDSTSHGSTIKDVTFQTGSVKESMLRTIDAAPKTESYGTMTIPVPYLNLSDRSLEFVNISYSSLEITCDRYPTSDPSEYMQDFSFSSLYTIPWAKVNWGSSGPEYSKTGIGVHNIFSYTKSLPSSGRAYVDIFATASTTLGYYTTRTNGRTQFHSMALDDLTIEDTIVFQNH